MNTSPNCPLCATIKIDSAAPWQIGVFANAFVEKIATPERKVLNSSGSGFTYIYRPNNTTSRAEAFGFAKNIVEKNEFSSYEYTNFDITSLPTDFI